MGATLGMAGAAVGANIAGQELGNAVGGGNNSQPQYYTPDFVNQMNSILRNYTNQAINTNTNYTNQAINQQNTSLNNSTNALNNALTNATNAAQSSANQGLQTQSSLLTPMLQTQYNALDAYNQSLGLSTPIGGSYNEVINNQTGTQQAQAINNFLQQYGNTAPTNPTAPNAVGSQQSYTNAVTQQQIQDYINQNIKNNFYTGVGSNDPNLKSFTPGNGGNNYTGLYSINGTGPNAGPASVTDTNQGNLFSAIQNSPISGDIQNYLGQQAYRQAQNQYNQQNQQYQNALTNYNNYNTALNNLSYNPTAIQTAAANGLFGSNK